MNLGRKETERRTVWNRSVGDGQEPQCVSKNNTIGRAPNTELKMELVPLETQRIGNLLPQPLRIRRHVAEMLSKIPRKTTSLDVQFMLQGGKYSTLEHELDVCRSSFYLVQFLLGKAHGTTICSRLGRNNGLRPRRGTRFAAPLELCVAS